MNALATRAAVILGIVLLAPVAATARASAELAGSGIVIHDAEETLRDWCETDSDGRLWLLAPGGLRFELIASPLDPAIPATGDGRFHPFDASEVRSALAAVRYPLHGIAAHVFLLPAPRRHGMDSAAGPGLILLSPGVRPVAREHQHAELVHELGHVVQYARMPDSDHEAWERYRTLRGIADTRYSAGSAHADRPHEIFAEDFRYLFGGRWANTTASIENAALTLPDQVAGLEAFLLALASPVAPVAAVRASPNPSAGAIEFLAGVPYAAPLDLFDAGGRRVATVAAEVSAAGTRWRWDGRGAAGTVLFAKVRGAALPALRVARLR